MFGSMVSFICPSPPVNGNCLVRVVQLLPCAPRFFCRELRKKKERVIIVHHSWEDGMDLQRIGEAKMTASANTQEAWWRREVVDLNPWLLALKVPASGSIQTLSADI